MPNHPAVINITGLVEGDTETLARVAEELCEPCATWGAFQIVGHGIPDAELARFGDAMQSFFSLPLPEKQKVRRTRDNAWGWYDGELTKNRRDWKEIFDFGPEPASPDARAHVPHSDGVNQWPAGRPELCDVLRAHYLACERVALALLRALCASLGLPPDALHPAFEGHTSFLRLNRYAPCPDPAPADAPLLPERGELGVHHHTDAGALTLLLQDEVAGLQIEHAGQFELVEPVSGALAVNLGDMLQVFSNDRYRSPVHRVLASVDTTRHSAPFFLNPTYHARVAPLEALTSETDPPRYRAFPWSEFRDARSTGDYADAGEEVQISDYQIAPSRVSSGAARR